MAIQAYGGSNDEILEAAREALRTGGPLDLLILVSDALTIVDPRELGPYPETDPYQLAEMVDSLNKSSSVEATALLMCIRAMTEDAGQMTRLERALAKRSFPVPDWVISLDQVVSEPQVWFINQVLGDGDDYLVGVTWPSGESLSALIQVDHNTGLDGMVTAVKGVNFVPEALEDLGIRMGIQLDDQNYSLTRIDPAQARAVLERGIASGAELHPSLQSDEWPLGRPLLEWMLRKLPSGGVVPERRQWPATERDQIAEGFFCSSFGAGLDTEINRHLLDHVFTFGAASAAGDLLRWGPDKVRILMLSWFPGEVLYPPKRSLQLPDLLRAFIRHGHDSVGIRAELTAETLDAIDRYESRYRNALDRRWSSDPNYEELNEIFLNQVELDAGGHDNMMSLDEAPLQDEPFDWAGVAEDVSEVVHVVLWLCDDFADEFLDREHRTAMRRFLARAARGNPRAFRGSSSAARTAAAVAWVVLKGNLTIGFNSSRFTVGEVLDHFGVSGSVAGRAKSLMKAAALPDSAQFNARALGDPSLLVSVRRHRMILTRDGALRERIKRSLIDS